MRKRAITLHYATDKYLLFFFNIALYISQINCGEENSAKSMYAGKLHRSYEHVRGVRPK